MPRLTIVSWNWIIPPWNFTSFPELPVLVQRRINQNGWSAIGRRRKLASGEVEIKIFPQLARELPRMWNEAILWRNDVHMRAAKFVLPGNFIKFTTRVSPGATSRFGITLSLDARSRLLSFALSLSLVGSSWTKLIVKFHRREQASCREDNRVNILSFLVVWRGWHGCSSSASGSTPKEPLLRGDFFSLRLPRPLSRKESNNNILDLVLLLAMSATFNPIVWSLLSSDKQPGKQKSNALDGGDKGAFPVTGTPPDTSIDRSFGAQPVRITQALSTMEDQPVRTGANTGQNQWKRDSQFVFTVSRDTWTSKTRRDDLQGRARVKIYRAIGVLSPRRRRSEKSLLFFLS